MYDSLEHIDIESFHAAFSLAIEYLRSGKFGGSITLRDWVGGLLADDTAGESFVLGDCDVDRMQQTIMALVSKGYFAGLRRCG